jgi:hypothetical protein
MKAKKLAKRLRSLSADLQSIALNSGQESKEAERSFTIAKAFELLAVELTSGGKWKKKQAKRQKAHKLMQGTARHHHTEMRKLDASKNQAVD